MILSLVFATTSILFLDGTVVDGLGGSPFVADVRVVADRIEAIGDLVPQKADQIVNIRGLVLSPGFIDAHSHADGGIADDPSALTQITQGITTAIIGQDGIWREPMKKKMARLRAIKPAINFASFSGHGGIRAAVMGEDYKRQSTEMEQVQMTELVRKDMVQGSLGLSSGLEYDPGYYADTAEVIALAKATRDWGGMYISHARDEGDKALKAYAEVAQIGRDAGIPAQISHIKLCTFASWGKAAEVDNIQGVTADIYPYLYWQSTAAALTPSRDWEERSIWQKAFDDVGGPGNVRLSRYSHNSTWVGKTFAQIALDTGRDAISLIQEVLRKTNGPNGSGSESVIVTAMTEPDVEHFMRNPRTMFSSDGSIGGSHPRGAGSFPRVLGRYVRERKTLSLEEAIRKMTTFPAKTFGLTDRGVIKSGAIADIVVFDPESITDHATPEHPQQLSTGIKHMLVSGAFELRDGKPTGVRNGKIVLRGPRG